MSIDRAEASHNSRTVPLTFLFTLTTVSALFFAFLPNAPLTTIVVTFLLAPVWIRTEYLADAHRRQCGICSKSRWWWLLVDSVVWMILTVAIAATAFVLVSLLFGLMATALGLATGMSDMTYEVAIVGTAGGSLWGIAAGLIAFTLRVQQSWHRME